MHISNLTFDKTLRLERNDFKNLDDAGKIDEPTLVVNIAFAYAFSIAPLSTMGGEGIEVNKHVGHLSTLMRVLTAKDGDLLSYFDKIDESLNGKKGSSLNQILIANLEQVTDRVKIKGQLPLERLFGFCKTFKNFTEILVFHLNSENC